MSRVRVRPVTDARPRCASLARLERAAHGSNLFLLDLVLRLGEPAPRRGTRSELLGAWRGDELVGVAALRPSLVLDATARARALEAFFPLLGPSSAAS